MQEIEDGVEPLVSIIIPTYNRSHLIGMTLDSVLAQKYQNFECIVVDDGSTDHTAQLLEFYCKKDGRIKYHERPDHLPGGANPCRNYGFRLSQGEYINWFDSDDVMLEDFLNIRLEKFTKENELVICSGYYVDEYFNNRRKMMMDTEHNLFKGLVLWKRHIITNSVIFRRSFLEGKILFHEKIERGQEMELFSRLFFKLPETKFRIINTPLFLYREHPTTVTANSRKYIKGYVESQCYTALENLKRGIEIGDDEIISFCYSKLIYFFFRGLEKNHIENSRYILRRLVPILWKRDRRLSTELGVFGAFLLTFKRGSYRIERKFRHAL